MGRSRAFLEGIRFASDVASDPSRVVTPWKTATGGKAVGCLPEIPVPEILHAANLLVIAFGSPGDLSLLPGRVDAWLVGTDPSPFPVPSAGVSRFTFPLAPAGSVEVALDRVEALAQWAGAVSGFPVSEGELWKSIRAYAALRALLDAFEDRCARETSFLAPGERRDIVRAGAFLPPEARSQLLTSILGTDPASAPVHAEGERGDPLILLAKRLM